LAPPAHAQHALASAAERATGLAGTGAGAALNWLAGALIAGIVGLATGLMVAGAIHSLARKKA
jgi:predicted DNA repair protein MutK